MSFRRSKNEVVEQERWRAFCAANEQLIARLELPSPVVETQDRFEDLLMHGYLDHHHNPTKFSLDSLDSAKMEDFRALVDRYFETGYFDPGLMALGEEKRQRLAKGIRTNSTDHW